MKAPLLSVMEEGGERGVRVRDGGRREVKVPR